MRAQMTVSDSNDDHGNIPTPKPPRGSGLYTATWAVLAVTATGYMAALLLEPEWAAPLTTQSLRAEEPSPAQPELVEQLTGEVNRLRETISDLQRELTEVKAKAAAREVEIINQQKRAEIDPPEVPEEREPVTAELQQEESELLDEPAQVETAAVEETDVGLRATDTEPTYSDVPPDRPQVVQQSTDMPTLAAAEEPQERRPHIEILNVRREGAGDESGTEQIELAETTPAVMPPPPTPVKKIAALRARPEIASAAAKGQEALPMATASLPRREPPAIVFGPAIVTPASEAFAIRLETGPSLDALRLRWSVLSERHQSALRDLEPRYLAVGTPSHPSYELLAGPITSLEEASRICALLRDNMIPCSVGGQFEGEAL